MALLQWILAGFLIITFFAYWKLTNIKYYGKSVFSFRNRLLIALAFPILLIFLIFFGSLIFIIVFGVIILIVILYLLFWIFGSRRI